MATSVYVEAIDLELGEMTIAFDGRPVTYAFGELDEIVLAYATTIHKSQGSEYPAVVIPVSTQHYMMLQRNLLYTGVTRGKRLVILLRQKKAVAIAVKNVSGRRRWSKLREWLTSRLPSPCLKLQEVSDDAVGEHAVRKSVGRLQLEPDDRRGARTGELPDFCIEEFSSATASAVFDFSKARRVIMLGSRK